MSTKTKALTAMGTALLAPLAAIPAAHAAGAPTAKAATAGTKLCAATTTAARSSSGRVHGTGF